MGPLRLESRSGGRSRQMPHDSCAVRVVPVFVSALEGAAGDGSEDLHQTVMMKR